MPKNVFIPLQLAALVSWAVLMGTPASGNAANRSWRALSQNTVPNRGRLIADRNSFSVEPISGQSGGTIPVFVTLPDGVLGASGDVQGPVFLLFRGVPAEISFSVGFRVKGNWAVGVGDLGNLALLSDAGYAASLPLQAVLHLGSDRPPLEQSVSIDLRAPAETPEPAATSAIADGKAAATPASLAPAEAVELLRRADTLLHGGDFESARLIYSEIASHGNAQAAVLMARTYDPEVLGKTFVVGMTPDAERARQWYRKAMELGEATAKQHFDRLAAQR